MSSRNSHTHAWRPLTFRHTAPRAWDTIAQAYDHVGDAYACYADGEAPDDPATASARSAHADTIVWQTMCTTIDALRDQGISHLRILDAGCGPGTWLRRIVARAHRQGLGVEAVGFDISAGQLDIARRHADSLLARVADLRRPTLEFLEHSLTDPLPWSENHFHIVLCNFAVLNHLPKAALPGAIGELCRVASHRVIATLRALASPPTACIVGTDQVRELREDCERGQLALVLEDGTRHVLTFNLHSADTLRALFAPHASVVDIRAVDLFLSRFTPSANWTKALVCRLAEREQVMQRLKDLEEPLCRLPGWIDHGTHVLIVAAPNRLTSHGRQRPA